MVSALRYEIFQRPLDLTPHHEQKPQIFENPGFVSRTQRVLSQTLQCLWDGLGFSVNSLHGHLSQERNSARSILVGLLPTLGAHLDGERE